MTSAALSPPAPDSPAMGAYEESSDDRRALSSHPTSSSSSSAPSATPSANSLTPPSDFDAMQFPPEPQAVRRRTLDPSTFLPEELLFRCTAYLDAASLLKLRAASRGYRRLASSNEAGWESLCQALWRDKVHVCREALEETSDRRRAYQLSITDARRNHILPEEFVFDPTRPTDAPARVASTVWSFRFKESAGEVWTAADPWYLGQPCRKLVFLPNGTVRQYEPLSSPASGGSSIRPTRALYVLTDPPLPMTWRFLPRRPMDLPARPYGSYVRMSVAGRDVPTYSVKRCSSNWGFTMESCWGVYASFELPPRRSQQTRRRRRLLRRTEDGGARWVVVLGDNNSDTEYTSSDSSSDTERQGPTLRELQDDSTLTMTNDIQWREAFLYNAGARVLPEGDEATEEFDRAWGGLRQTS